MYRNHSDTSELAKIKRKIFQLGEICLFLYKFKPDVPHVFRHMLDYAFAKFVMPSLPFVISLLWQFPSEATK